MTKLTHSLARSQVLLLFRIKGQSRARKILTGLVSEKILVASGAKKDRMYRLKNSE